MVAAALFEPGKRPARRLRPFPAQQVVQRAPAEVLHHDEGPPLPRADVEDRDRPRLGGESRRREALALEPRRDRLVGCVALGEHLHHDLTPERLVRRQVDVAHRTVTDAPG